MNKRRSFFDAERLDVEKFDGRKVIRIGNCRRLIRCFRTDAVAGKGSSVAVLTICTYPDPVLRRKAERVNNIDNGIQRLIDDMIDTMYDAPGVGLAANQVGMPQSVIVVDIQRDECEYGLIVLINPELVSARGEMTFEEGCLSVPEYFASVKRHEEIVVRGLDREGKEIEIAANGMLAIALQHEMDHLEGKLFIDLISPVARDIFKRRWKKKLKEEKE